METSLRYDGDSKALRIHAKEKFPIDSNTHLQVNGELDTGHGGPTHFSAALRHFYPNFTGSLGVGLLYNKEDKLLYSVRGKKEFPLSANGLVRFNIKGRYYVDREFHERKARRVAEFTWSVLNVREGQDVRFKLGYEVFDKVTYFQIRENNWSLNGDSNGKWNVRYDL
uniref:Uncharacterized protein n=1 Tax=Kalanchoe fedtschenkoi TaxID=63787 RepID=A0A7N0UMY0_KALFE